MKIEGANFGNYDSRHLSIVRREVPQSIKPDVFRDIDKDVAQALIFSDVVSLSPEAKEMLRKLKKQLGGKLDVGEQQESVQELIYNLRQLRDLVYGKEDEPRQGENGKTHHDNQPIQLSGPDRPGKRPKPARPGGHLREIVDRMMVYAPSDRGREAVKDELVPLGEKMLDEVARFNVRIIVLEPNRPLTALRVKGMSVVAPGEKTFDGRPWDQVRGLYDGSRRLMVLGLEVLGHPERSAARHEFAHAFDHTFSERNKRRQPLSVQLWNLFAAQRKGLVTPYAGTNPAEYFAESVETFFKPRGREVVLEKDPQMYQYLEALFAS